MSATLSPDELLDQLAQLAGVDGDSSNRNGRDDHSAAAAIPTATDQRPPPAAAYHSMRAPAPAMREEYTAAIVIPPPPVPATAASAAADPIASGSSSIAARPSSHWQQSTFDAELASALAVPMDSTYVAHSTNDLNARATHRNPATVEHAATATAATSAAFPSALPASLAPPPDATAALAAQLAASKRSRIRTSSFSKPPPQQDKEAAQAARMRALALGELGNWTPEPATAVAAASSAASKTHSGPSYAAPTQSSMKSTAHAGAAATAAPAAAAEEPVAPRARSAKKKKPVTTVVTSLGALPQPRRAAASYTELLSYSSGAAAAPLPLTLSQCSQALVQVLRVLQSSTADAHAMSELVSILHDYPLSPLDSGAGTAGARPSHDSLVSSLQRDQDVIGDAMALGNVRMLSQLPRAGERGVIHERMQRLFRFHLAHMQRRSVGAVPGAGGIGSASASLAASARMAAPAVPATPAAAAAAPALHLTAPVSLSASASASGAATPSLRAPAPPPAVVDLAFDEETPSAAAASAATESAHFATCAEDPAPAAEAHTTSAAAHAARVFLERQQQQQQQHQAHQHSRVPSQPASRHSSPRGHGLERGGGEAGPWSFGGSGSVSVSSSSASMGLSVSSFFGATSRPANPAAAVPIPVRRGRYEALPSRLLDHLKRGHASSGTGAPQRSRSVSRSRGGNVGDLSYRSRGSSRAHSVDRGSGSIGGSVSGSGSVTPRPVPTHRSRARDDGWHDADTAASEGEWAETALRGTIVRPASSSSTRTHARPGSHTQSHSHRPRSASQGRGRSPLSGLSGLTAAYPPVTLSTSIARPASPYSPKPSVVPPSLHVGDYSELDSKLALGAAGVPAAPTTAPSARPPAAAAAASSAGVDISLPENLSAMVAEIESMNHSLEELLAREAAAERLQTLLDARRARESIWAGRARRRSRSAGGGNGSGGAHPSRSRSRTGSGQYSPSRENLEESYRDQTLRRPRAAFPGTAALYADDPGRAAEVEAASARRSRSRTRRGVDPAAPPHLYVPARAPVLPPNPHAYQSPSAGLAGSAASGVRVAGPSPRPAQRPMAYLSFETNLRHQQHSDSLRPTLDGLASPSSRRRNAPRSPERSPEGMAASAIRARSRSVTPSGSPMPVRRLETVPQPRHAAYLTAEANTELFRQASSYALTLGGARTGGSAQLPIRYVRSRSVTPDRRTVGPRLPQARGMSYLPPEVNAAHVLAAQSWERKLAGQWEEPRLARPAPSRYEPAQDPALKRAVPRSIAPQARPLGYLSPAVNEEHLRAARLQQARWAAGGTNVPANLASAVAHRSDAHRTPRRHRSEQQDEDEESLPRTARRSVSAVGSNLAASMRQDERDHDRFEEDDREHQREREIEELEREQQYEREEQEREGEADYPGRDEMHAEEEEAKVQQQLHRAHDPAPALARTPLRSAVTKQHHAHAPEDERFDREQAPGRTPQRLQWGAVSGVGVGVSAGAGAGDFGAATHEVEASSAPEPSPNTRRRMSREAAERHAAQQAAYEDADRLWQQQQQRRQQLLAAEAHAARLGYSALDDGDDDVEYERARGSDRDRSSAALLGGGTNGVHAEEQDDDALSDADRYYADRAASNGNGTSAHDSYDPLAAERATISNAGHAVLDKRAQTLRPSKRQH